MYTTTKGRDSCKPVLVSLNLRLQSGRRCSKFEGGKAQKQSDAQLTLHNLAQANRIDVSLCKICHVPSSLV